MQSSKKNAFIIGLDEVGRGSLAGPVYVSAVMVPRGLKLRGLKSMPKLRDSKKLSSPQREQWFSYIKKHPQIRYAVASVDQKTIDKMNISKAANMAAGLALKKLIVNELPKLAKVQILFDAGLQAVPSLTAKRYTLNAIIKGDEKIPAISLASIAAKVSRDRFMKKMHSRYPAYGFIKNVGYGTKSHQKALRTHGLSKMHRISFCSFLGPINRGMAAF